MDADVVYLTGNPPNPERLAVDRIEDIAQIAERSAAYALELERISQDADPSVRYAAAQALDSLVELFECAAVRPRQAGEAARRTRSWQRFGTRIEQSVLTLRWRIGVGRGLRPAVHRNWPAIGLAATLVGCWGILNGHYLAALALILGRVCVSTLLGYESTLPFESADADGFRPQAHPRTMWASSSGIRLVSRCLIGHLCDLLPLLAFGHLLGIHGRLMWASAVLGSACLMLLATLFRVSALQVGVPLNRLMLERVLRVSSLMLALLLGGVVQPVLPSTGVPLLALAAVGPVCYALLEIARTALRLRSDLICSGDSGWTVWLSRRNAGHSEAYRKEVQRAA